MVTLIKNGVKVANNNACFNIIIFILVIKFVKYKAYNKG